MTQPINAERIQTLMDSGLSLGAAARKLGIPHVHADAVVRCKLTLPCPPCPKNGRELLDALIKADRRQQVLLVMGGRCIACGFDAYPVCLRLLRVHGRGRAPNSNDIRDWAWERLTVELNQCVLLCANCSGAVQARQMDISDLIEAALSGTGKRLEVVERHQGRSKLNGMLFGDTSSNPRAANRAAGCQTHASAG